MPPANRPLNAFKNKIGVSPGTSATSAGKIPTLKIVSRKVRLAAYAPEDWQFGGVRQAWLTAGVPEDEIACVFRDRDEALAWLLRRRASA